MNKLFSKPSHVNQNGFNGHDLSFHRSFTSMPGMLLPVAHDFANAGEKYKLNSRSFIRTEALQTAAFVRLKHHTEWFFVPITQIYSLWNEFFNGTNDVMSSIFTPISNIATSLPTVDLLAPCHGATASSSLGNYFFSTIIADSQGHITAPLNLDTFGIPRIWNYRRLMDLFGYGNLSKVLSTTSTTTTMLYCPLLFCAYHKIFHSHYRNTDWTANDPLMYNLDKYYTSGTVNYNDYASKIISEIHYRPYRKDYFTNIYPQPMWSPQYAGYMNNSLFETINRGDVNSEVFNPQNALGFSGSSDDGSTVQSSVILMKPIIEGMSGFSSSDIRAVFALDKLARITAMAGSHYDEQVLAHLGVKIPKGIGNEAYKLGEQSFDIIINEVVASATTDLSDTGTPKAGTVIGDIAGKAFGTTNNEKDISFKAPCDGIVMAISSIEVLPNYSSSFTDLSLLRKSPFDFWRPEFDNLGMQPFFIDLDKPTTEQSSLNLKGWQYRYSQFKCKTDVVNEGFYLTNKNPWVSYKQILNDIRYNSLASPNFYFYHAPQLLNNIFLVQVPFYAGNNTPYAYYDAGHNVWQQQYTDPDASNNLGMSPNTIYAADNFLIDTDFKIYKSSKMSIFSLPKIM